MVAAKRGKEKTGGCKDDLGSLIPQSSLTGSE